MKHLYTNIDGNIVEFEFYSTILTVQKIPKTFFSTFIFHINNKKILWNSYYGLTEDTINYINKYYKLQAFL